VKAISDLAPTLRESMANMAATMSDSATCVVDSMLRTGSVVETRPTEIKLEPDIAAISAVETNEGLSEDEMLDACDVFVNNPKIGEVYLALSNRTMRTRYLQKQLNRYRGEK
jgi:hypothetical protein